MMATEATVRPSGSRAEFANEFHGGLYIFHRRFWQNAVPYVEDVTRPRPRPLQQFEDFGAQLRKGCEQRHRVEITLDCRAVADIHPGLVDIDAPVAAHHIASSSVQFAEKAGGASSEVDHG